MKPQLSLLTSTALSATYPVSLKLIYAAEGAPLSPAVITSLRFALMAGGAAFILSDRSAGASVEQPWWSSRRRPLGRRVFPVLLRNPPGRKPGPEV